MEFNKIVHCGRVVTGMGHEEKEFLKLLNSAEV